MENIKEQLEEVVRKHLPEKKPIITDEEISDVPFGAQIKEQYIGFNQALSQINTSLIADEVLKVVVETKVEIIKKLQEIRREILKNDPHIANQLENIIIELNK